MHLHSRLRVLSSGVPLIGMLPTNARHEAMYQELLVVLGKYDLPAKELLAVTSNMVGKILAMQDQRTMTVAGAMEIVSRNIEEGNRQAVAGLQRPEGST